jgi:nucleotide-binding universal stress UspA family protein
MNERRARVVVGVADSPSGLRALRWAVEEARRRGIGLCAVRTWRFDVTWKGPDVHQWRTEVAEAAKGTLYATFAKAVGGVPADLAVEVLTAEGPVGQVLVDQAGEDDMVVVGASTRARWWSFFSVARYCLRRANCPVVTVPAYSFGRGRRARALERELRRSADEYVAIWAERGPFAR